MSAESEALAPPARPEFVRPTLDASNIGEIVRPLSLWERVSNITLVRRVFILLVLAAAWQAYGTWLDNDLIFPSFSAVATALWKVTLSGELPARVFTSIKVLLMGYGAGVALAAVLTTFAVSTRIGTDFLSTLTSMFNPLPAIALLPLALL